MRTTKTLSITIPPEMLSRAEALAKKENRTMSELVREVLRHYERQRWWDDPDTWLGLRFPFEGGRKRGCGFGHSEVRGQIAEVWFTSAIYLCNRERLIDRLQFLAGLEADGLARRNRNFGASARIPPNACLARTHVEHTKTAQLNAVAGGERLLHALEHGLDCKLRLGLGDPGSVDHFIDDVELNHGSLPSPENWYGSSY